MRLRSLFSAAIEPKDRDFRSLNDAKRGDSGEPALRVKLLKTRKEKDYREGKEIRGLANGATSGCGGGGDEMLFTLPLLKLL